VPTVLSSLELDHNEVRIPVNTNQIDAPLALVPLAELCRDEESIGRDRFDV
jgi:hypothetical protein